MGKTYIVGIAGESASGKSTFSERLKERLADVKVKVIHMDEHYKEEERRPRMMGMIDGREYIDDNHPLALDFAGIYQKLDRAGADGWDVILLEGIFALWDEKIFPVLDLKIYVDCDRDERFARRIRRHMSYGQDFEEITARYVQAVAPRQREYVETAKWKADIIVNGFLPSVQAVEMIAAWIKSEKTKRSF